MKELLAKTLRRMREEKGWTLKEAEEASGVHLSYISAIENQRRKVGVDTLEKFADIYGNTEAESDQLLKNFLLARAAESKHLERLKTARESVLRRLGFLGRAVFECICIIRGETLKQSRFRIISEDELVKVDWKNQMVEKRAVIQIGKKITGSNFLSPK